MTKAFRDTISSERHILALSDGRAGNVAMAEGLAAALADRLGGGWSRHDLDTRGALARIPPRLWTLLPAGAALRGLALPDAEVVIGAGRRVAPVVAALERKGRARGVQILDSGIPSARFAAVVTPTHDGLSGSSVIETLGSPNRIGSQALAAAREEWRGVFAPMPSPRIAVLLGGATKRRPVLPERIDALAADLAVLGGSPIVTASRRTGEANIACLRAALPEAWFWDGQGANPYLGMLAWADAVIVSDDSVNMASEAASAPAPVAIWPLTGEGEGGKIARFHAALYAAGVAEPFAHSLPTRIAPPLAETARAAGAVARLLRAQG